MGELRGAQLRGAPLWFRVYKEGAQSRVRAGAMAARVMSRDACSRPATRFERGHIAAFRDVSFFNNALQQRMKPETMSRAAMLRRNKIYRVDATVIVRDYKQKHPNARKGAKA